LPALTRAAKLGRRAARLGFDWANAGQVRDKVSEELAELDGELKRAVPAQAQSAAITEELGDLLFALVNFARHLHIDAEAALRDANRKFERRFREMERLAAGSGVSLSRLSANEWDALWEDAKRRTARAPTDPNS
jgi:MazG family protein